MFEKRILKSLYDNSSAPALFINSHLVTYSDLSSAIRRIQSLILSIDHPSPYCCVVMGNDIETYASIFAILLMGKAYVVLNPEIPLDRNRYIVETTGAGIIVSSHADTGIESIAKELSVKYVRTSADIHVDVEVSALVCNPRSDDDPAYVLFTSGSTGVPKGVLISTSNLDAFIDSFENLGLGFNQDDRVLQMFDLTFDVSVAMLLVPIISGSCIYTVPSGDVKYISAFKLAIKHQLTYLCIVPSMLAYLRKYFCELSLPYVRCCILTAEASSSGVLTEWAQCIPNSSIWNLFGPTEATIWCLAYHWRASDDADLSYNSLIPIGKPMKNVDIAILDQDGNSIELCDIKGELCLSGQQVSEGYLNNDYQNSKSFIEIGSNRDKRHYKTGDLVYINRNNDIQYCGRIDHQVQIQGFRVELSEIEHYSRSFSATANVVAMGLHNTDDIQVIVLFIEASVSSQDDVIHFLKQKLPYYMLPAKIVMLQSFPLNNSSKIDRLQMKLMYQTC